jgi:uncharacterized protein
MQYSEGSLGRVFVLRLETGDRLPDTIEAFALEHGIENAMAFHIGGVAGGSRMVVGPKEGIGEGIIPNIHALKGRQEILGIGTIFPKESGKPSLHMHAGTGRAGEATVGCTRPGVDIWLIGEFVIVEILGVKGRRCIDRNGLELLQLLE